MKAPLLLILAAVLSLGLAQETSRAAAGCGNGGSSGTSKPCPTGSPCPTPAPNQPCGSPLDAYTGNGHYTISDLKLFAGVGEHTLEWMRYSNTRYTNGSTPFGNAGNYRHSYQWEMVDAGLNGSGQAQLDVFHPNGVVNRFTQISPTQWNSASDVPDVIYQDGDAYSLKTQAGWRYNFNRLSDGGGGFYYQLQSFADSGQVAYTLSYDGARRLQSVSDPAGRSLQITYQSLPITNVAFTTLGAISATPPAGAWQEILVSNPQPLRYVRYRGADNSRSMVAEVEFYDAAGNKLAGTPFGAGPATGTYGYNAAFDGNTGSSYSHGNPSGGYCGLDLGANPAPVAKIRYYPPGNNNQYRMLNGVFQGANALEQTIDVVSRVDGSDGRSVTYQYQQITDSTLPYRFQSLMSATYGDGTVALYTYAQVFPGTRPLLATAHDPRSMENLRDIKYVFDTSQTTPLGVIASILNNKTGSPILTLSFVTGHVPKVSYPNGGAVIYTMDATHAGLMSSKLDPLNNTTSFVYDQGGFGYMIRKTDPLGRVMKYTYSPYGNLLSVSPPDNHAHSWTRDDLDLVLTETDELGRTTTYTRDSLHRVTQIAYPDGSTESFTYNGFNQVLTHTLRNGGIERNVYDARGMKTTFTDAAGHSTAYTYDAQDRLATATDANNHTTGYAYNDRRQVTTITFADTKTRGYGYDEFGNRTSETNDLNKTWKTTYDEFRRVTSQTDPLNRTTAYDYNVGAICGCALPYGKPTRITLPSGKVTTITYDAAWQKVSETVGAGTADEATTFYSYDAAGNLTSVTDPRGKTWVYTYDGRDRRNSATDPLGNKTQWTYDYVGNRLTETRPDASVSSSVYDYRNRLIRSIDAKNQWTKLAYDNADNLVTLTDPKNNTYSFAYDLLNRKTRMTYPGGSHEDWSYDPAGNLATYTTRAGQVQTFSYDFRNRELGFTWSDSTPAVSKTYDAAGRLWTLNNSNSHLTYEYDDANQLLSETSDLSTLNSQLSTKTISYTYDADGNRQTLTYPDGTVVSYAYTGRNQVETITTGGTSSLVSYTYDDNGNRLTKSLENGTSTAYGYDDANRLLTLDNRKGAASFARFDYAYNNVGNRKWRTESGTGVSPVSDAYAYDPTDQLTSVAYRVTNPENPVNPVRSVTYNYDGVGNRTTVQDSITPPLQPLSYTTNNLNQYTRADAITPTYDANGNLKTYGEWTYTYDAQNRLLSARSSLNPQLSTYFSYDARNRCIARTTTINNQPSTIYLYYDGWSLICERDSSDTQLQRYIHGPVIDEILTKTDATGTVYYHHDAIGSTVALTDSTGSVVESYSYDVYGSATIKGPTGNSPPASAAGNRFLFTGRDWIGGVGLYDYRNRMYSTGLGRFLQRESEYLQGDVNAFRYAFNSPIIYRDSSGMVADATTELPTDVVNGIAAGGSAAQRASEDYYRRHHEQVEFCGLVCNKCDTKLAGEAVVFTGPVQGSVGICMPQLAPPCPTGNNTVATYHNHPSGDHWPSDRRNSRDPHHRNDVDVATSGLPAIRPHPALPAGLPIGATAPGTDLHGNPVDRTGIYNPATGHFLQGPTTSR